MDAVENEFGGDLAEAVGADLVGLEKAVARSAEADGWPVAGDRGEIVVGARLAATGVAVDRFLLLFLDALDASGGG